jgi:hypothetical protein
MNNETTGASMPEIASDDPLDSPSREEVRVVVVMDLEALPNAAQREEQITASQLRKNIAFMTVLQFVLTYPKWSISLFLLFASLATPLPTPYEQVQLPMINLRAVVQTEAALYHECVKSGFELQDVQMDRAVQTEQVRVQEQRAIVQQQIQTAADATSQCFNSTLTAQRAMQGWDVLGLTVPKTYNSTNNSNAVCTVDDQKRLAAMLTEDLTKIQNNVNSILEAYIAASLASMHKILKYSQERESYDYNYFIGVKMQAAMHLLDHFAAPNIFLSFPEQRLVLELRGILQGLLDALHGAYIRVDLLALRIADFETSIQAFYVNYIDLYGRFALIGAFVTDFLPDGMPLPDYFNISGIPMASALLPPIFTIPQFPDDLPNIEDLVSEYIVKALKLIAQLLQEAAEEASEQTRRIIEEIIELLKELMIMEDYDPPKYPKSPGIETPDDEVAYTQELANKTKTDAASALDDIKNLHDDVPDYTPVNPGVDVGTPTLDENDVAHFNLLDLGVPEIVIPVWILTVIGYICSRTLLIECLTQAVRLYRLKRKYEKNATPELPEIDYLTGTQHDEDGDDKDESKPSKLQVAQAMLLKNLMNPWVILGLMIIPFILTILIFWFPHVKSTCIDSRRGTFLARNVFKQIQVNKANSQGYALHTVAQLQCYQRQRAICNLKSAESDAAYHNDDATLLALQGRFNESTSTRGVIDRCVDNDILDKQFHVHCCGLEGYTGECSADQQWQFCPIDTNASPPASFRPVGESLMDSACAINLNELSITGALFNCSMLEEKCNEVPCSGVDADLIGEMTIEADCSAEIYAIQVCIFFALTVYHAIMINVGNSLLFNGIMHVRWKSLTQDGIKMMTHVNRDGKLVKGGDLQERTDRVNKAMQRFVLAGYIQIGLSVAVFVFWMTTFLILRKAASHLNMYHA